MSIEGVTASMTAAQQMMPMVKETFGMFKELMLMFKDLGSTLTGQPTSAGQSVSVPTSFSGVPLIEIKPLGAVSTSLDAIAAALNRIADIMEKK